MADIQLNAIVTKRIEITTGLIILQLSPDGWELPEFKPGQFTVVGLPGSAARIEGADPEENEPDPDKLIRRAYSITSHSESRNYLEFYITLVYSGALTPRLFALKEGDRVMMGKKATGMFTLDKIPEDQGILMLATGTGLAPYMSMTRSELKKYPNRKFTIVHGARNSRDLGYHSELCTLMDFCPNFTYIPIISRPELEHTKWTGQAGNINDIWNDGTISKMAGYDIACDNTHALLCGNPLMIDSMVEALQKVGFSKADKKKLAEIKLAKKNGEYVDPAEEVKAEGQVHLEEYW